MFPRRGCCSGPLSTETAARPDRCTLHHTPCPRSPQSTVTGLALPLCPKGCLSAVRDTLLPCLLLFSVSHLNSFLHKDKASLPGTCNYIFGRARQEKKKNTRAVVDPAQLHSKVGSTFSPALSRGSQGLFANRGSGLPSHHTTLASPCLALLSLFTKI